MESPVQQEGRRAAPAEDGDPGSPKAAARSLSQEVNAIWTALTQALDLQRRAAGLLLFDAAWRLGIAALGAVGVMIAAASATLLLIVGARRGLAVWTANAWWSDLVLGAVLAAALCIGLYSLQRSVHRSALKQAQRKLSR